MNKQFRTGNSAEGRAGLDVGRRNLLKLTGASIAAFGATSIFNLPFAKGQDMSNGANNFYTRQKVTFKNQYQMNVAGKPNPHALKCTDPLETSL